MNAALQARAFWVTAAGQGKLLGETLPEPGPQDVLVRALYSAYQHFTRDF